MQRSLTSHRTWAGRRRAWSARVVLGATLLVTLAPACTTDEKGESGDEVRDVDQRGAHHRGGHQGDGHTREDRVHQRRHRGHGAPQITEGAQLAADRINAHENGVNGHPIDLVSLLDRRRPQSRRVHEQARGRERGGGGRRRRPGNGCQGADPEGRRHRHHGHEHARHHAVPRPGPRSSSRPRPPPTPRPRSTWPPPSGPRS